jgi:antitoxin component YwqK of YwqJK toxin-antitoxin module
MRRSWGALASAAFTLLFSLALIYPVVSWAAQRVEERDRDGDGKKESKFFLENDRVIKIVSDRNHDGKADATTYYKNNRPDTEERDDNFDGKIDVWVEYDETGMAKVIGRDRARADGKPDYWIYLRKGFIYQREWDRNFDGKPDFRTLEKRHRLLEKQYDDNFDGRFEKTIRAPEKGATGRIQTSPGAEGILA